MVPGFVICHGDLAAVLVHSAEKIMGHADGLNTFSNHQSSPKVMVEQISEVIVQQQLDAVLIMVDLRGGSCWRVGKMLLHRYPGFRLISGVNLPMMTAYLTKRPQMDIDELAATLETDGHRGIVLEKD